jgi:hypothetical protein
VFSRSGHGAAKLEVNEGGLVRIVKGSNRVAIERRSVRGTADAGAARAQRAWHAFGTDRQAKAWRMKRVPEGPQAAQPDWERLGPRFQALRRDVRPERSAPA